MTRPVRVITVSTPSNLLEYSKVKQGSIWPLLMNKFKMLSGHQQATTSLSYQGNNQLFLHFIKEMMVTHILSLGRDSEIWQGSVHFLIYWWSEVLEILPKERWTFGKFSLMVMSINSKLAQLNIQLLLEFLGLPVADTSSLQFWLRDSK